MAKQSYEVVSPIKVPKDGIKKPGATVELELSQEEVKRLVPGTLKPASPSAGKATGKIEPKPKGKPAEKSEGE